MRCIGEPRPQGDPPGDPAASLSQRRLHCNDCRRSRAQGPCAASFPLAVGGAWDVPHRKREKGAAGVLGRLRLVAASRRARFAVLSRGNVSVSVCSLVSAWVFVQAAAEAAGVQWSPGATPTVESVLSFARRVCWSRRWHPHHQECGVEHVTRRVLSSSPLVTSPLHQ